MIKKSLFLATCLLLVFPVLVSAGEGSDTVGDQNLLLQLRYDYSVNDYDSDWDNPVGKDRDFDFSSHSVYLRADYGLTDNVDIYGLFGYRLLDADVDGEAGMGSIDAILWGVGLKGTFYRADSGLYFGGGLGLTHAFTPGKVELDVPSGGGNRDFDYNELNITADLHFGWHFKEIGLTPYFGVEYRYTWLMLEGHDASSGAGIEDDDTGLFNEEHNFGIFAGIDYFINDRFYMNVEGHAFNYWGGSFSIGYLFDSAIPNLTLSGVGSDTLGAGKLLPQIRYSYIYNEFDTDYEGFATPGGDDYDYIFRSHSAYVQLNYGLTDNIDIYALLGYRNIDVTIDGVRYTGTDIYITGNIDALLWGMGLKGTFYRAENGFYVGGGIGFTHAFNPNSTEIYHSNDVTFSVEYNELNLTGDLHAGWHFKEIGLTPYFGVECRYTWATLEELENGGTIDEDDSARFTQKNNFGVFLGLEYLINDKLYFNVEGHAVDYWGGSAGFGYMFDL